MKNRWGAYTREQRGAWLLVLGPIALVLLVLALRPPKDRSEAYQGAARHLQTERARAVAAAAPAAPERFTFDPNTVGRADLLRLGLSEKQADGWLRFRGERRDAFRRPSDIGKLYVLSEADKQRLIPLARPLVIEPDRGSPAADLPFDPNTVSQGDLERLGLSRRQARAFRKFRDAARYPPAFRRPEDLGRFRALSAEQLAHLQRLAVFPPPPEQAPRPRERFAFDPNRISADSLELLGFPAWQARALVKYRAGRPVTFRRAGDLLRVSALDSALVRELLPLVRLPEVEETATVYRSAPPPPAELDINTADTATWKLLPGVGGYRARRIVRFREVLGGFASVSQVGDTRGLPDSVFRKIRPYLVASPVFRRLQVNHDDRRTLAAHPYVSRKLANAIVSYRGNHGLYTEPADLANIRLLSAEQLDRLRPYLSFD